VQLGSGDIAPAFQATTHLDAPISLDDFRGRKVWLAFFRFSTCPLCSLRLHEMRDLFREHESVHIAGFFRSPRHRFEKGRVAKAAWFPIVPDPDGEIYDRYHLNSSFAAALSPAVLTRTAKSMARGNFSGNPDRGALQKPGDFLVDYTGSQPVISHAEYGDALSDRIDFARVRSFFGL